MPNLAALKAQLRIQDQATKDLAARAERAEKRRKELKEQIAVLELKALGLIPGAKYRMIPKDKPGDILEGTFKRFSMVQWSGRRMAIFRCPQTGRFKEQMRHLPIEEWEFERVNGRSSKQ